MSAVQNAVVDALAHLGVRHIDMPMHPMRVWEAIRAAQGEVVFVRDARRLGTVSLADQTDSLHVISAAHR